ncbi:MAG TPA: Lrp/AsnC family transcriptional regulator [Enhygromyxa sp.]|nr:Lrp/AsnC family transcriptional regulator [Enhygromyxa sp.]
MSQESQPLDRIDHEILAALQKNARLSNKELAAAVDLAPSSCLARVARLIREGVLRGFHADVDRKSLGIGLEALVFVRVVQHQSALMDALRDHLIALPEVLEVYYVAGSHDLVVHVAVRDVDHLRTLVAERISSRAELGQLETSLIFSHWRSATLPDYARAEATPARKRG